MWARHAALQRGVAGLRAPQAGLAAAMVEGADSSPGARTQPDIASTSAAQRFL